MTNPQELAEQRLLRDSQRGLKEHYASALDSALLRLDLELKPSGIVVYLRKDATKQPVKGGHIALAATEHTHEPTYIHCGPQPHAFVRDDVHDAWGELSALIKHLELTHRTVSVGNIRPTFGRFTDSGVLILPNDFQYYHTDDVLPEPMYKEERWRGHSTLLHLPFGQCSR